MDSGLIEAAERFIETARGVIAAGRQNPPVIAFFWRLPPGAVLPADKGWTAEVGVLDFSDDRTKEASFRSVHNYVRDRRVEAVLFLCEAWGARERAGDNRRAGARPDRWEVLACSLYTPSEQRQWTVKIERGPDGFGEGVTFGEKVQYAAADARVDPWSDTRRHVA